jgi:hypothetical protein
MTSCWRAAHAHDPLLKRFTSWLFYKLFSYLADIEYDGQTGNFRIMSRKVAVNFLRMREQLRFFGGLVQWMGFPTASIEVEHAGRFEGRSTYTFAKLWKLATETIIAYSDKPLRLSVRFGFLMAFFAFFYGVYIIARAFIYGSAIPGWNSLIVSLYFIGGIIIAILGILGIYLATSTRARSGRCISSDALLSMSTLIKPTPWDTAAFGMPTWELTGYSEAALQQAAQTAGHHTIRVDPLADKRLLDQYGFYYCDTLIEPRCNAARLRPVQHPDANPEGGRCRTGAGDRSRRIRVRPLSSRFQSALAAAIRYDNWLKQLLEAGQVYGLYWQGGLAGFIGYSADSMVLHALAEQQRGKGRAKFWWSAVCNELLATEDKRHLSGHPHDEIRSSISASNLGALNLYARWLSFGNPQDIYHRMTRESFSPHTHELLTSFLSSCSPYLPDRHQGTGAHGWREKPASWRWYTYS